MDLAETALMEMFAWKEEGTCLKDVWRCVTRESGSLSVIICGALKRQKLSVDSWDTQINQIVSLYNYNIIESTKSHKQL